MLQSLKDIYPTIIVFLQTNRTWHWPRRSNWFHNTSRFLRLIWHSAYQLFRDQNVCTKHVANKLKQKQRCLYLQDALEPYRVHRLKKEKLNLLHRKPHVVDIPPRQAFKIKYTAWSFFYVFPRRICTVIGKWAKYYSYMFLIIGSIKLLRKMIM